MYFELTAKTSKSFNHSFFDAEVMGLDPTAIGPLTFNIGTGSIEKVSNLRDKHNLKESYTSDYEPTGYQEIQCQTIKMVLQMVLTLPVKLLSTISDNGQKITTMAMLQIGLQIELKEVTQMSEDITRWIACDKCGDSAQAMWLIKMVAGELYFCGHHKNAFEEGLAKVSYEMIQLNKVEEPTQQLVKAE